LPTLRQLYEELGTDFDLSLDLKDPHAAADVVDVGTDAGTLPRMWLCGELPDVLQWRSLSSEVRLVNSTSLRGVLAGERAGRLVSGGIDAINLRAPEWTSTRMEAFHRHGVWAFAWDVQTTACRRQLLNEGCDAIYSDSVPLLLAGS
jgi:glycerophosphoryl diester phosphodiesterase